VESTPETAAAFVAVVVTAVRILKVLLTAAQTLVLERSRLQ
jgi:hypothetical protein